MSKVVISRRGSKDFFARGGHKKLKQQGVRGFHAKKFMAVLALFGQELQQGVRGFHAKNFMAVLALFGQELMPA